MWINLYNAIRKIRSSGNYRNRESILEAIEDWAESSEYNLMTSEFFRFLLGQKVSSVYESIVCDGFWNIIDKVLKRDGKVNERDIFEFDKIVNPETASLEFAKLKIQQYENLLITNVPLVFFRSNSNKFSVVSKTKLISFYVKGVYLNEYWHGWYHFCGSGNTYVRLFDNTLENIQQREDILINPICINPKVQGLEPNPVDSTVYCRSNPKCTTRKLNDPHQLLGEWEDFYKGKNAPKLQIDCPDYELKADSDGPNWMNGKYFQNKVFSASTSWYLVLALNHQELKEYVDLWSGKVTDEELKEVIHFEFVDSYRDNLKKLQARIDSEYRRIKERLAQNPTRRCMHLLKVKAFYEKVVDRIHRKLSRVNEEEQRVEIQRKLRLQEQEEEKVARGLIDAAKGNIEKNTEKIQKLDAKLAEIDRQYEQKFSKINASVEEMFRKNNLQYQDTLTKKIEPTSRDLQIYKAKHEELEFYVNNFIRSQDLSASAIKKDIENITKSILAQQAAQDNIKKIVEADLTAKLESTVVEQQKVNLEQKQQVQNVVNEVLVLKADFMKTKIELVQEQTKIKTETLVEIKKDLDTNRGEYLDLIRNNKTIIEGLQDSVKTDLFNAAEALEKESKRIQQMIDGLNVVVTDSITTQGAMQDALNKVNENFQFELEMQNFDRDFLLVEEHFINFTKGNNIYAKSLMIPHIQGVMRSLLKSKKSIEGKVASLRLKLAPELETANTLEDKFKEYTKLKGQLETLGPISGGLKFEFSDNDNLFFEAFERESVNQILKILEYEINILNKFDEDCSREMQQFAKSVEDSGDIFVDGFVVEDYNNAMEDILALSFEKYPVVKPEDNLSVEQEEQINIDRKQYFTELVLDANKIFLKVVNFNDRKFQEREQKKESMIDKISVMTNLHQKSLGLIKDIRKGINTYRKRYQDMFDRGNILRRINVIYPEIKDKMEGVEVDGEKIPYQQWIDNKLLPLNVYKGKLNFLKEIERILSQHYDNTDDDSVRQKNVNNYVQHMDELGDYFLKSKEIFNLKDQFDLYKEDISEQYSNLFSSFQNIQGTLDKVEKISVFLNLDDVNSIYSNLQHTIDSKLQIYTQRKKEEKMFDKPVSVVPLGNLPAGFVAVQSRDVTKGVLRPNYSRFYGRFMSNMMLNSLDGK